MIEFYKKRGETPLETLGRLRIERSELKEETLSYAGRLDPMAEGVLPVLVGREENMTRKDFLSKDKEYEVQFLIGCSSDTGDVLGIITKTNFEKVESKKIINVLESLTQITKQTYPWYSSKTVDGIPLFEYARKGNFNIKRPVRDMQIYSVTHIRIEEVDVYELIEKNIQDVESVAGDFRQEEIVEGWRGVLEGRPSAAPPATLASCTLKVSSGTYIRSLTEEIEKIIERPVLVQRLIRTKVF